MKQNLIILQQKVELNPQVAIDVELTTERDKEKTLQSPADGEDMSVHS